MRSFLALTSSTAIALLVAFYTIGPTSAQNSERSIPARMIPAPAAASAELRESIMGSPDPDIAGNNAFGPTTDQEWKAFVTQSDGAASQAVDAMAQAFGVTFAHHVVDGVNIYQVSPNEVNPDHEEHRFLFVHGGAYVIGGGEAGLLEAFLIASRAKIRVISIDYRMPPDHPFPAAVDDVITIYRHVLQNRPAKAIALGGTSAGGGLTLASIHRIHELGLETPGAIYAGTPWADLTKASDSLHTNQGLDRILVSSDGLLKSAAALYAGGEELTHHLISPVYGDFNDFPPTYLVTGTRDMLLSDTVRVHRKLRANGNIADLNVYEGFSHADYLLAPTSPESQEVYAELDKFLLTHLD